MPTTAAYCAPHPPTWSGAGCRASPRICCVWRLKRRGRQGLSQAVKVRGALSTNDGGIAVNWALDGHGILMRAEWDIERHVKSGRLVQVLPQYDTPDADIHAVFPKALQSAQRVRAFVDFLAAEFESRDH